eukprot:GEZU01009459.1.p1 GENE.GEZU01009459.1~~GEZU01009459.1.p1  ORF type:complete len:253 (-),score=92.59 GEZU01009459.1:31-789(-)
MSTAHRPTYNPAVGGANQGGSRRDVPSAQVSVHAIPAYTKMKTRKPGQNTKEEIKERDLRSELEDRERKHFDKKAAEDTSLKLLEDASAAVQKKLESPEAVEEEKKNIHKEEDIEQFSDSDDDLASSDDEEKNEDGNGNKNNESDSDSESDSDDDDEDAALLRELEKIKKERAEERARKEREEQEAEAKRKAEAMLRGNPLLGDGDFSIKRRWDDDVVFKNQARGEVKPKKRFINDTIRNDFHRRFLDQYMK